MYAQTRSMGLMSEELTGHCEMVFDNASGVYTGVVVSCPEFRRHRYDEHTLEALKFGLGIRPNNLEFDNLDRYSLGSNARSTSSALLSKRAIEVILWFSLIVD
ncbi:hypothetical protein K457DRAFT_1879859 [Linnemannia elongata AG-77]|uniref:Uncharacterized protein n=1 Tax=Linnemannia elongata AG-77 TaxID=1314771 RepID=A0A197JJD3_9FUNG|nr:hypothetical protein K457DRAFT_1879859 [Linnemannia elongata AG-77]